MKCKTCGHELEDYKIIKEGKKEFRIYKWEDKPFNEFKIPKGFRICEFQEVNKLIEDKLIKYSGDWEVFFTKHFNKMYQKKGISRLYLVENVLYSINDYLTNSNFDGRVVVVK